MSELQKKPLKVALHGMDVRSCKTIMMFFQGPCRGAAVVVADSDADIDVFDGDAPGSRNLLTEHLQTERQKPTVVLSLQEMQYDGVLSVKKPVKTDDMLAALQQSKVLIAEYAKNKKAPEVAVATIEAEPEESLDSQEQVELKTYSIDPDERKKVSKHQTAMRFDEKGFQAYIGAVTDVDVNDPKQFIKAAYDPKDYFQGYLQSAYMVCRAKGQILQLQSGWRPILIFPHTHEVWLDADDPQLRAFAGIKLGSGPASKMSISPAAAHAAELGGALDKFQTMDAFLWKLACWTSKGRYPNMIDVSQPVYLKCWPNFTRLMITPHALQITALLVRGPRTLPNVAEALDIKPQYVFLFASAACALGLMGQSKREVDRLIQPEAVTPSKRQGLFSRIMSKLRA